MVRRWQQHGDTEVDLASKVIRSRCDGERQVVDALRMPALTNTDQNTTRPSTVTSAITALKTSDTLRTVQGSILRMTAGLACTGMAPGYRGLWQCTDGPVTSSVSPLLSASASSAGTGQRRSLGPRGQVHDLDPAGVSLLAADASAARRITTPSEEVTKISDPG